MTRIFMIRRKDGKGSTWYIDGKDIFKKGLVTAFQKDGFTTKVDLEEYDIIAD